MVETSTLHNPGSASFPQFTLLLVCVDTNFKVIRINPPLAALLETNMTEVAGRSVWREVITGVDGRQIEKRLATLPDDEPGLWFASEVGRADKRRLISWHLVRPRCTALDQPSMVFSGVDITALMHAEQQRQATAIQAHAIVRTAVDAIIVIDKRGRIESFNPAAEKLFGYSAAQATGQNVSILMPEPYASEHTLYLENYLETGVASIIGIGREVTGRKKDGSLFPMYLSVGEFQLEDGPHFAGIVRDRTEVNRMQAQIIEVSDREKQLIGQDLHDGVGQVLSGAAFLAKALSTRLRRKAPDESAQAEQLAALISSAISQNRQLSRGLQPISDADELPSALEALAMQLEAVSSVKCAVRVRDWPRGMDLNTATHLYRIAQEALNNATKHARATQVEVGLKVAPSGLRLMIRDDGIGLVQSHSRRKGLGLSIMQYRARAIGGRLDIRSTRGNGTTIICEIDHPIGMQGKKSDGQGKKNSKSVKIRKNRYPDEAKTVA